MESNFAFIFIHGIGNAKKGYSDKMKSYLKDVFPNAKFIEFLWSDYILEGEKEIFDMLTKKKIDNQYTARSFFITHVSDIVAYFRDDNIRKNIQNSFMKTVTQYIQNSYTTVIVSHSLGSVIAFDVLKKIGNCNFYADYFITMGSPLALFINDYRKNYTFFEPIKTKRGWLNIINDADYLAYPLEGLDNNWSNDVIQDYIVNNFFFVIPFLPNYHKNYFSSNKFAKIISNFINKKSMKYYRESFKDFEEDFIQHIDDYASKITLKEMDIVLQNFELIDKMINHSDYLKKYSLELKAIMQMLSDYKNLKYIDVEIKTISLIVFALSYILLVDDYINDEYFDDGYKDDVRVLKMVLKEIYDDIVKYIKSKNGGKNA